MKKSLNYEYKGIYVYVCMTGRLLLYLDIPGGPRGGVGAPQGPRDTPRAPHADCRALAVS